ncbi:transcriptional repressor NrdR [Candidatus Micrarchaeota archaeon]|nr:transcriptional repressor NrdR [Candidatus Micrarchaeota archaeon]
MRCPFCGCDETKVIDSRQEETAVRRRRECEKCRKRFTTYERIESLPLYVVKKDGRRELFSKNKLRRSMTIACTKRPVSQERIEQVINAIEMKIKNEDKNEIPSSKIGRLLMNKLKRIDSVAYIRFASVYHEFDDLDAFERALESFKKK